MLSPFHRESAVAESRPAPKDHESGPYESQGPFSFSLPCSLGLSRMLRR